VKNKHLTDSQFQRLREYLNKALSDVDSTKSGVAVCLSILLETGIRAEELGRLAVRDFLTEQRALNITGAKGSMDRSLRLSAETAQALSLAILSRGLTEADGIMGLMGAQYLLCPSRQAARHAAKQSLRAIWRDLRDTLLGPDCADLGLHCLRHTLAVRLLQHTGGNIIKARVALGHRAVSSTLRYSNYIESLDVQEDVLMALWPTKKAQ